MCDMNTNASLIAGAIIVAGIIVAGAVIFSNGQGVPLAASPSAEKQQISIRPVDVSTDHIRGNPEAPITIVEFSDFECPFCARFHPVLIKILEEFPEDVRWVYRQLPLTSIHSSAMSASLASECVARASGNTAFWEFADDVFANQDRIGDSLFFEIAQNLGIDRETFQACLEDEDIALLVDEDLKDAADAGARGTPFSIIITADDKRLPFSGALPYEQVRGLVEQALGS